MKSTGSFDYKKELDNKYYNLKDFRDQKKRGVKVNLQHNLEQNQRNAIFMINKK